MCSFILAFLLLIVIFDLINDSVPDWHIAQKTAQTKGSGTKNVVLTLQGFHSFDTTCFAETAAHSCGSPFQGQTFDQSYPETNHHVRRNLALEVQPLPTNQQKDCIKMRDLLCALEQRVKAPYRTKTKNEDHGWEDWPQFWEERHPSWQWDNQPSRSHSRSSTHSSHSAKSQTHATMGKRGKGKGKKKVKGGKESKGTSGTTPLSSSPFSPLASQLPPWPTQDTAVSTLLPSGTSPTTQQIIETVAQKREVIQALKNAYPDNSTAPSETKELIEKMEKDVERLEKENSKATTKNLHTATKSLGKAQKVLTETLEARRAHRVRWTKHITDAAKTWETQLHEYRQQQASFQEVAAKARADIEFARSAIQTLSAKATTATLASMPPITPISAESEDLTLDDDQDAETAQQHLQNVLQSCAASLGMEAKGVNTGQAQGIEDDSVDNTDKNKKRPRAMEPFAGGGQDALPSSTPKQ